MHHQEDRKLQKQKLPEEVLNAAQDPSSMKDPLQAELEKTAGDNPPQEQETLNRLRKAYGEEGNPQPE